MVKKTTKFKTKIKLEDNIYKNVALYNFEGLSNAMNIEKHFDTGGSLIKLLPTEFSDLNASDFRVDILAEFPKKIVNIENQSTDLTERDLKRFRKYAAVISYNLDKEVETFIIITAENPNKKRTKELCDKLKFHPTIIYTQDIDGEHVLENIKYKVKNNLKLDKKECAELSIILSYGFKKDQLNDKINEIIEITNQIKNPINEKELILLNQLMLIDKIGTEEQRKKVIAMITGSFENNRLIQEIGAIFVEKAQIEADKNAEQRGIKIGRIEEKIEVAKELYEKNLPIKDILEVTKLTQEEFNKIIKQ